MTLLLKYYSKIQKLKGKVLNTKSPRLKENLHKEHSEKDKEVKGLACKH